MMRKVCKVLPNGDIDCPLEHSFEISALTAEQREALQANLDALFPGQWGTHKIELVFMLLTMLGNSRLPDVNVGHRADHILGSVEHLLATAGDMTTPVEPPSILLFNFSNLAALALGPWILVRKGRTALDDLYGQFPGGDVW